MFRLPDSRGEISRALLDALTQDPHTIAATDAPMPSDPLSDDDLRLALYLCDELHYRGLPGVSDEWEWEPSLLALRRQLEARFEAGLLDTLGLPAQGGRPSLVGAAAPDRRAEGRDGRDPGRRVRRR